MYSWEYLSSQALEHALPLVGLILPAALLLLHGIINRYRYSSSSTAIAIEQPPVAPVTTFQWIKARLGNDYPLKSLAWCRQINSPVYQLVTKIHVLVHTTDVHLMRQVLLDPHTTKPSGAYRVLQETHGGGRDIVTDNGIFWKHSRKGVAPAFSKTHLTRMTKVVEQQVQEFIQTRIRPMMRTQGASMDVCQEMVQLTLRVICEAAFEYSMSEEEQDLTLHGFTITMREGIKNLVYPLRAKLGRYLFRETKESLEASKRLVELGFKILNSHRSMKNPTTKGTVIHHIVQNTNYESDKERVNDILIFLFAGHDTTAYSLSWTLLELAKKPHEQRLLRQELLKHPQEERIHVKRLKHVAKEGMRIQPVAPIQMRMIGKDIIYQPKGESSTRRIFIPKGSKFSCSHLLLCRNEKYFPNPDEFLPDRWDDASADAHAAVMPFVVGKRNCIGQSLAMIEIHCVLARLCSEFHFTVEDEGVPTLGLTWKPLGARLGIKKCDEYE